MTKRTLGLLLIMLAWVAPAEAQRRPLNNARVENGTDVRLADDALLGKLSNGRVVLPSDNLDPQAVSSIQVSPRFCPYPQLNGTDSNNACVQSAINYACSLISSTNGTKVAGRLIFGRATYRLTGVTVPKSCAGLVLEGQGSGGTGGTSIYSDEGCTAPVINFYPDATENYVYGGGVRDLHFFNNRAQNGGFTRTTSCLKPLIQANYGRDMFFLNNTSLSPYTMYKMVGGINILIDGVGVNVALPNSPGVFEFVGYGARPDADGQARRQDVINLNNVVFFSAAPPMGEQYAKGIWWHGFSASLRTNNVAFTTASTALKVDCTTPGAPTNGTPLEIGACPSFAVFNDFETECAGDNCIDISDAYNMQFNFLYVACYARTSTATPHTSGCNNGVRVRNDRFRGTADFTINGGFVNNAQASGINFEGYKLTVTGGTEMYGNNAANVGGSDITLEAPVSGAVSGSHIITGNKFCTGPVANTLSETALNVIGSSHDYIVFANNVLRGCGAGILGGVGPNGVLGPNAGP